ncbi:Zinc finger protein ZPR1 [Fukomys damarensis]|uniref:Zinc finger protein ZPR1 n=1 Tax=Fukomys damarensis TaxID=885580 RepID=A0A091D912_FUKDA|nr:Zinc finger protein ZPR1 [Fukomys damarensis]
MLDEDLGNEVLQFNTNFPEWNAPAQTNMKLIQISHFKEVIMAIICDNYDHQTTEVKSGGAVEPLGIRITFHITDTSSRMKRSMEIPELESELGMGASSLPWKDC